LALLRRFTCGDHEHAEILEEALAAYRAFGITAYAAESERLRRQAQN
jgi:hypothetical protein